jgi:hypothetical protein
MRDDLDLLRTQVRAYRERLAVLETRLGVGEARMDEHDVRLEAHEGAIVDSRVASMQFAAVVEDMQRTLDAMQRDIAEERQP